MGEGQPSPFIMHKIFIPLILAVTMTINNNGVANVKSGWDSGDFVVLGNDNTTELIRADGVNNTITVRGVTVTNGGDATFQDITADSVTTTGDISGGSLIGNFRGSYYHDTLLGTIILPVSFVPSARTSGVYQMSGASYVTLTDPGANTANQVKIFRFIGGGTITFPYAIDGIYFYTAANTVSTLNDVVSAAVGAGGYLEMHWGQVSGTSGSQYWQIAGFNGVVFAQ